MKIFFIKDKFMSQFLYFEKWEIIIWNSQIKLSQEFKISSPEMKSHIQILILFYDFTCLNTC